MSVVLGVVSFFRCRSIRGRYPCYVRVGCKIQRRSVWIYPAAFDPAREGNKEQQKQPARDVVVV